MFSEGKSNQSYPYLWEVKIRVEMSIYELESYTNDSVFVSESEFKKLNLDYNYFKAAKKIPKLSILLLDLQRAYSLLPGMFL